MELADNSRVQHKCFANTFAKLTSKQNHRWRVNGSLPPKKLLTDENIRQFIAHYWTLNFNKKTTQAAKSYISWCLKENRLEPFVKEHEHVYLKSWKYFKTLKKDKRWEHYSPDAAGRGSRNAGEEGPARRGGGLDLLSRARRQTK